MLRFAEEIMLLRYALAGGVLMDLAMENRIDTDLDKLILVLSTIE